MKTRISNYNQHIDTYMDDLRSGKVKASQRLLKAMDYIEVKLNDSDVFIDHEKIDDAIRVMEDYFEFGLLDWERFIVALIHCYYKSNNTVVFSDYLILMGRGNGKNGFVSALTWYLTTPNHGVKSYNVDIVANNEEQAKTSFNDVYEMLEDNWKKMKSGYHKIKTQITCKPTKSYLKYNTSNSNTKDGKRSACLVFDEIHEYEDFKTINVFQSGFGKKKHSRTFYITTNGYVRGGVLDRELEKADDILDGAITELKYLPLIYEMDSEEECADETLWEKANPSINHFSFLKEEAKKHWIESKYQPSKAIEFYTKRMNLPKEDTFTAVASWDKISATNQPIPYDELEGLECIGGLDYASVKDFCSVGLLFKHGGKRYYLEHSFVNQKALQVESREIKFPVMEMVERGQMTIVKEETISPGILADWFIEQSEKYRIKTIMADDYRASYVRQEFEERGLPLETCRSGPITHAKLAPLVESMFANEEVVFGDSPQMRWYTNNVYTEMDKKGNITYLKIEPQTRKTDGFFSLLHALTRDDELKEESDAVFLGTITF